MKEGLEDNNNSRVLKMKMQQLQPRLVLGIINHHDKDF